jgi:hypothetical protein
LNFVGKKWMKMKEMTDEGGGSGSGEIVYK